MTDEERSIESRVQELENCRAECRRKIRSSIMLSMLLLVAIALWGAFFSLNLWIAGAVFAVGPLSLVDEVASFRHRSRKLWEMNDEDDSAA